MFQLRQTLAGLQVGGYNLRMTNTEGLPCEVELAVSGGAVQACVEVLEVSRSEERKRS